jgi:hypothetical protein
LIVQATTETGASAPVSYRKSPHADPVKPLRCAAASAMGNPDRYAPGASGVPRKLILPESTLSFFAIAQPLLQDRRTV